MGHSGNFFRIGFRWANRLRETQLKPERKYASKNGRITLRADHAACDLRAARPPSPVALARHPTGIGASDGLDRRNLEPEEFRIGFHFSVSKFFCLKSFCSVAAWLRGLSGLRGWVTRPVPIF